MFHHGKLRYCHALLTQCLTVVVFKHLWYPKEHYKNSLQKNSKYLLIYCTVEGEGITTGRVRIFPASSNVVINSLPFNFFHDNFLGQSKVAKRLCNLY